MPRNRCTTGLLLGLSALLVAGCGSTSTSTSGNAGGASTGRPIAVATPPPSPTAPAIPAAANAQQPEAIRPAPPPSPSAPRSRAILLVASRFARAYFLYQIGRSSPSVAKTIDATCTPPFAHLLLSQPATVPSGARTDPAYEPAALTSVTYTGKATLGPGPFVEIVIATYHTIGHPSVGGQLTIHLTASGGGWRVAALG
jgi:hypothetical protein